MTVAEEYGAFAGRIDWSDLPVEVRDYALDLLADWIANAAAGFDSPIARSFWRLATAAGAGRGRALVLGNLKSAEVLAAALINGSASHAVEFDDAHRGGLYHPGAPVIAAVWAAAGAADFSGRQLVCAIAAGYEISMRLAQAINPGHYKIWHTTGTVGALGAAAGAARCLGLDPVRCTGALGLAGTQAAGLWEILPDAPQAKGLHAGKAAHSGVLSALLSREGIAGPASILEGPRGFLAGMAPEPVNLADCTADLGRTWWLPKTTIKAYPVCGHTMTPIEAALQIAAALEPGAIEKIEIKAHPVSIDIAGNPAPKTEAEAKFSIEYCVASALLRGEVTQREFAPERLAHASVRALLAKTTLTADDGLARVKGQRPAEIRVTLSDGRVLAGRADVRKGDPENPLSAAEKKKKFIDLAERPWGRAGAEKIYRAVRALPDAGSVQDWMAELAAPDL